MTSVMYFLQNSPLNLDSWNINQITPDILNILHINMTKMGNYTNIFKKIFS